MKHDNQTPIPNGSPSLRGEGDTKIDSEIRIELGYQLRRILIETRLRQREIATLLATQQPEVSHLLNGHFNRFTIDKLIQFFNRMGWEVKFQIHPLEAD